MTTPKELTVDERLAWLVATVENYQRERWEAVTCTYADIRRFVADTKSRLERLQSDVAAIAM